MRVDDGPLTERPVFEIETHCIYRVFLVMDIVDLLLVLHRDSYLELGSNVQFASLVVYCVLFVILDLLGSLREKTYLSIRYSLRPRKDSIRNLTG